MHTRGPPMMAMLFKGIPRQIVDGRHRNMIEPRDVPTPRESGLRQSRLACSITTLRREHHHDVRSGLVNILGVNYFDSEIIRPDCVNDLMQGNQNESASSGQDQ